MVSTAHGMSWSSCFLMHPHACCTYAYKTFSCMISIINRITAYVYYLLQNLLVHRTFLIEFKKYDHEDERKTTLLTYIQSCPLLTSYICYNFRHQQRMCHWQCTLLSVHSLPHTNAILGIFSDSHGSLSAFNSLFAFAFLKLIRDPCSMTTVENSMRNARLWGSRFICVCTVTHSTNDILCVYEINHS